MCYTPFLSKIKNTKAQHSETALKEKIQAKGSYLITGGLGGLGVTLAQWLLDNGASHLILTGRGELNEKMSASLQALKSERNEIRYEKLDVSDENAVAHLLNRFQNDKHPLKGIFHLAGVIDDASLVEQDWSHFEKVFAPKVYGSFYLHHYSKDLDLFVTFSSIASLLGSPGQSNYAAANAFMDALCEYRRQKGMPALSVSLGPWADVGMASTLASRYTRSGFVGLKSQDGMRALGAALLLHQANIGAVNINWKNYLKPLITTPVWLRNFADEKISQDSLSTRLKAVSRGESLTIIKHYVMDIVRAVLGVPASEAIDEKMGFFDMGLDSLMAVDLKNRLQEGMGEDIRIGSTIVFDYSSISKITEHLASKFGIHAEEKSTETTAPHQTEEKKMAEAVEDLSEEEAMRKLQEELGDE